MRKLTSFFFLATVFCCTFEKVHWSIAGTINLSDILALAFLICFAILVRPRFPRTAVTLIAFFFAFLLVYMIGFYNLESSQALAQFAKGMVKFVIHFSFMAAAVVWFWRRGLTYYWNTLVWFTAGMVFNAGYGVLQLLVARAGGNLDNSVIAPFTGGQSSINLYGVVGTAKVFRPNALTGDPNHLGVMLIVPLLVLLPVYLRLERGAWFKRRLAVTLAFLLVVEIATLSRSGLLGLGVGLLVLASPYRDHLRSRALLAPLGLAAFVLAAVAVTRWHYISVIFRSRFHSSGARESAHFTVYEFVPKIIHSNPLFGLGLNNFSTYYEFVTGKTNWGPHSFYVSLIVETGVVGATLYLVFILWVFSRLIYAKHLGRAMARAGNPLAARLTPLAWGFMAAIAGTIASNAFYLTMQFYYFYVLLALAVAVPVVFGREEAVSVGAPSLVPSPQPLAPARS